MARYLKRWESPRKEGRNDKGRGGAARQRQLKKRTQQLRKRLQKPDDPSDRASPGSGESFQEIANQLRGRESIKFSPSCFSGTKCPQNRLTFGLMGCYPFA